MTRKTPEKRSSPEKYNLCLMRHGVAAERADREGPLEDAKRPLTPEGKLKLKAIARGLEAIGVEFDWVVTSPLKRAVETGEVVAESIAAEAPRDHCEALAPGSGSAQEVIDFLSQRRDRTRVLLVGHEPDLSGLASELVGAGRSAQLAFKKGACCLISFDGFPSQSPGQLSWWLTPRILRKLSS
ncbi:MAG TPA: phosphohistidine phosphatase SixA [Terriglobia bacterium]|nr:phosphohistidine phosphatase SixA [Terriglobia bacterium]